MAITFVTFPVKSSVTALTARQLSSSALGIELR